MVERVIYTKVFWSAPMLGEQGGEIVRLEDFAAFVLFHGECLVVLRPTIPFCDALGSEGVDGCNANFTLWRNGLQEAEDIGVQFIEDTHYAAIARVGVDGGDDVSDVCALVEETEGFSERQGANRVEGVVLNPLAEIDGAVLAGECGEF